LLPSWREDEADLDKDGERNSAMSGLALSVAFSGSFWAAVVLIVMRLWR
jgi:hypothetical protein